MRLGTYNSNSVLNKTVLVHPISQWTPLPQAYGRQVDRSQRTFGSFKFCSLWLDDRSLRIPGPSVGSKIFLGYMIERNLFLVSSKIHDNNHLQKIIIVMLTEEYRSVGVGHNLGGGTLPEDVFLLKTTSPY